MQVMSEVSMYERIETIRKSEKCLVLGIYRHAFMFFSVTVLLLIMSQ